MIPIVHMPTYDPNEEPLLTLAIICSGVCYTEYSGARAFSNCLSELIRRLHVYLVCVIVGH
jgi:hypothetical protein